MNPRKEKWQRFKQNRPALAGAVFIIMMIVVAIGGPFLRPDPTPDANSQELSISRQKPGFTVTMLRTPQTVDNPGIFTSLWEGGYARDYAQRPVSEYNAQGFTPFNEEQVQTIPTDAEFVEETFLLGTDKYGRDLLSRLMAGTSISLSVGFIAVLISLLIGVLLGALAGYFGGRIDALISWLINVIWSIPTLLMVIAITLAFGKGFWQVFIAVGLTMWVEVARIVRGQFLSIREKEYVEAARALGYGHWRIIRKHILPNAWGPVIVISAANFASAILIEAGLSFLGIGAQIPTPSWGNMIKEHYSMITTDLAYLAILPGVMIMLLVLSFMMVGNGLRDALDVRS
ncbi:ABC transporter permease [Sanyastnella coralliicola]|uniref:ABC transporter permease n=1 Tax=Sanyastnella coralliicola TaxID=3069118 RepID=UPI0027B8F352|nr:ABC transporter permease [Longitalea sp. SCSIO 12813]